MKPLPHVYKASVSGTPKNTLVVSAEGIPSIEVAPPREFGGPGNLWSPEELLLASVANCLVLSFRAIARGSDLNWITIDCDTQGTLDRVDKKTKITAVTSTVKLIIPANESTEKAKQLLQKAEDTCFISNSLNATSHLVCEISHQ
jgi:peroxiredoxin-like protein